MCTAEAYIRRETRENASYTYYLYASTSAQVLYIYCTSYYYVYVELFLDLIINQVNTVYNPTF